MRHFQLAAGLILTAGFSGVVTAQTPTTPACDMPQRAADFPAGISEIEIKRDRPLLPTGTLIPGTELFCSDVMEEGQAVRRWHERGALQSVPLRIDHYENGMGMAIASKASANAPAEDPKTESMTSESFRCIGWGGSSRPDVKCTLYPGVSDGPGRPFSIETTTQFSGDVKMDLLIHPRAFNEGTYVTPDRMKPITLKVIETDETETLYFEYDAGAMFSGIFGGRTTMDIRSAEKLMKRIAEGKAMTLSYTNSDGSLASASISQADSKDSAMTAQLSNQAMRLVYGHLAAKMQKP